MTLIRSTLGLVERASPALAARMMVPLMFRTQRAKARQPDALAALDTFVVETKSGPVRAWMVGEGPVVLLMHGWNGHAGQLSAWIPDLVEAGYRVVAFDAPGHGASDGNVSSLFAFADAVDAVVDAVRAPLSGPIHAIVAHSMGGAAVTYAMARQAQRLDVDVERSDGTTSLPVERFVFIAPPIDVRDFIATAARLLGVGRATRDALETQVSKRFGVDVADVHGPTLAKQLRAPLLVIHDRQDKEVPFACGEALVNAWPASRLMPTEGLGHKRILGDEAVRKAALGFLSER